jgi:DNA-binding CsgD family transcriptional regulator
MFGPLRGRSEQMARALSVVRGARRLGVGGVLLVTGPPGIGKTALVTEVRRQCVPLGLRVVGGKCDEVEQVSPGAPVIALLRSGRRPLLDAAEYERIAGAASEPLLLAERIAARLEQAAATQPLLITLDDVQWADRVSRFLLRTLVSRLAGLPIVWVLADRDAGLEGDLVCCDPVRVERIALGPLATSDLVAIAHDRLGRIPDARVRRYLDAVGGSPLLATHLIDNLARAADRGEPDSVPVEFAASIAHRLATLPPAARELVGLVAVAGRELSMHEAIALLSAAAEGEFDGREHACAQAVDAGLLVASDFVLGFRHDLVREAVCAALGPSRAREIHRRLADHYLIAGQPFLAASHARAASSPGDAAAAAILISAAEALIGLNANDAGELASLAFRALHVTQSEWLGLSRRCLAVLCRTERATDSIAVADMIRAQTDEPEIVGEVETRVISALWLSGRTGELRARADRTLRSSRLSPAVAARLRAAQALAGTGLMPGDVASKETEAALEDARASGDREAVKLALQAAAVAADNEARHVKALRYYQEVRALGDMDHLAQEITQLQFLDRYDHARTLLRQLNLDAWQNTATVLPAVHRAQMWMDFHLGRLGEADAKARALVELGLQLGTQLHALDAFIVQVAVALLRGDEQAAETLLARADGVIDADDGIRRPGLGVMHGWLSATRGELRSAVEAFRPILDGAGEPSVYWPLWPCWMGLFFDVGTAAGGTFAQTAVEAAQLAATRNPGVASFEGVALNLRGRHTEDMQTIEHSAKVLADSPRAVLRASGAETWGRALLTAGRRTEGLEQLDRAWDEYHQMGAHRLRAHVQRTMREAGARRAKWSDTSRPRTGSPELSQAERRVAALIGAGHTNKSAAAELGVSINTVGTHLRAVFTKLGIQSRVQLANELHRQGVAEPSGPGAPAIGKDTE